jgi:hypothetical protein
LKNYLHVTVLLDYKILQEELKINLYQLCCPQKAIITTKQDGK